MDADYERILCIKNEVFVYRIPPRTSTRGYRAADWKLDQPDWTGRMRIVLKGGICTIKFEDKISGDLFAEAPVQSYPGMNIEAVLDSSRYFVAKIQDPSGRHAFIGMGFQDRGDSFDFNVTLQDHFKREKQTEIRENEVDNAPKLDLGFKEGQTIKINIGSGANRSPAARPKAGGTIGVLPPPPGGKVPLLMPPPSGTVTLPPAAPVQQQSFQQQQQQQPVQSQPNPVEWGDFSSNNESGTSWVKF